MTQIRYTVPTSRTKQKSNPSITIRFISQVDTENQIDPSLKKMILAYLYEIIEDYSKSLEHWKDYVSIKHAEGNQIPYKVAIRILINSQQNKSLFFELLLKHVEWISQGISSLLQLFSQVRIDTILPETILERLKMISTSKDYDKILESFYQTMIQVHKLRSEPFHTELAKIYLKKVVNNKPDQHEEFRKFITNTQSKYHMLIVDTKDTI